MRALTLTQPWATLVAIGAKSIETRSWHTSYRGELAIHAAVGFPGAAKELLECEPFDSILEAAGYRLIYPHGGPRATHNLPLGAIVAVVKLWNVQRTEHVGQLSRQEQTFGNYEAGRWAWYMELLYRVEPPVPCKGALGLWDVPADIVLPVPA